MRLGVVSSARFPSDRAYGIALNHTIRAMGLLEHEVVVFAPSGNLAAEGDPGPATPFYTQVDLKDRVWSLLHCLADSPVGPIATHINRLRCIRKAAHHLRVHQYDLVWTRDVLMALRALQDQNQVVLEEHHVPTDRQMRRYQLIRKLKSKDLWIVAISESISRSLQDLGMPRDRILVEPSGVGQEFFAPLLPATGAPNTLKIGYFGSIDLLGVDKGLLDLISSAEFAATALRLELHLYGPSEREFETLLQRCKSVGLELKVTHFHPRLKPKDVPGVMRQMHALAYPAGDHDLIAESSPLKLAEYAASGVPILATQSRIVRKSLPHGSYFEYTFGDRWDFLKAVSAINENPSDAADRARRCQQEVKRSEWSARTSRILRWSTEG